MTMSVESFNRLSIGIIEKYKLSPAAAVDKLQTLKLNLICGEEINRSIPLQAALLTAVNTAKRAFLGGVFVSLPKNSEILLPWPAKSNLNKIVEELGGIITEKCNRNIFSLMFGQQASVDNNAIQVACNDWQGGILTDGEVFEGGFTGESPTAGVFAAGLAVALAFLKVSGINISCCDKNIGLSLWRPDLPWKDENSSGPKITLLPKKFWILGLGHLGQSYLWNIGLLPYKSTDKPEILLNDCDKIVIGNWSAGLLSELNDEGYKTRICSRWLESRGFQTSITERAFDQNTKRSKEEAFIALCGFDTAKSRVPLEDAGFDLIVEAGLGSNLSTFDIIALHTFPGAVKTAKELWETENETEEEINNVVLNILKEIDKDLCGIVPLTVAGKSLSASFVGACAGALVVSEILRALHGGKRFDKIVMQLRNLDDTVTHLNCKKNYSIELARNGWIEADIKR